MRLRGLISEGFGDLGAVLDEINSKIAEKSGTDTGIQT